MLPCGCGRSLADHSTNGYNISAHMEACTAAHNCTQEDALKAVQASALELNVPLRYFQWDDWAPLNWNWPPRAFPDGATAWLGEDPYSGSPRPMPLSLYNGLWGGSQRVPALRKYKWSPDGNIPLSKAFFDGILANGSKAGMVMFEQVRRHRGIYIYTNQTLVTAHPRRCKSAAARAANADTPVPQCGYVTIGPFW